MIVFDTGALLLEDAADHLPNTLLVSLPRDVRKEDLDSRQVRALRDALSEWLARCGR